MNRKNKMEESDILRVFLMLLPWLLVFALTLHSCVQNRIEKQEREARREREWYERERRKAEEEKEREEQLQRLADLPAEPPEAISVPYVGMPEKWVDKTGLGKHGHFHDGTTAYSGRVYESHTYSFWENDALLYSVTFEDGVATEVRDYRDNPIPRLHGSLSGSGVPQDDGELYYEDYEDDIEEYDEFYDYDDAAEAYEEERGGR